MKKGGIAVLQKPIDSDDSNSDNDDTDTTSGIQSDNVDTSEIDKTKPRLHQPVRIGVPDKELLGALGESVRLELLAAVKKELVENKKLTVDFVNQIDDVKFQLNHGGNAVKPLKITGKRHSLVAKYNKYVETVVKSSIALRHLAKYTSSKKLYDELDGKKNRAKKEVQREEFIIRAHSYNGVASWLRQHGVSDEIAPNLIAPRKQAALKHRAAVNNGFSGFVCDNLDEEERKVSVVLHESTRNKCLILVEMIRPMIIQALSKASYVPKSQCALFGKKGFHKEAEADRNVLAINCNCHNPIGKCCGRLIWVEDPLLLAHIPEKLNYTMAAIPLPIFKLENSDYMRLFEEAVQDVEHARCFMEVMGEVELTFEEKLAEHLLTMISEDESKNVCFERFIEAIGFQQIASAMNDGIDLQDLFATVNAGKYKRSVPIQIIDTDKCDMIWNSVKETIYAALRKRNSEVVDSTKDIVAAKKTVRRTKKTTFGIKVMVSNAEHDKDIAKLINDQQYSFVECVSNIPALADYAECFSARCENANMLLAEKRTDAVEKRMVRSDIVMRIQKAFHALVRRKHGMNAVSYCINKNCQLASDGFVVPNVLAKLEGTPVSTRDVDYRHCPCCYTTWCDKCLIMPFHTTPCTGIRVDTDLTKDELEYFQKNFKACPGCGVLGGGKIGCDKITCAECKIYWCWRCREKICDSANGQRDGYKHVCAPGVDYTTKYDSNFHE